ncbi:Na+/H+ antiporter NhaA [Formicincola oecophyllae]|uniref:Na+/H+ antiporter NhaA n=1 Tax=Formicincola oecophyllae TaxID=2558361 RepID=UPI00143D4F70|nr:Na+/H+ antiporter NhaA [Formicincola oecophyllae]
MTGSLLLGSAALAVLCASVPMLAAPYHAAMGWMVPWHAGGLPPHDVQWWITSGLLGLFFVLMALEIRSEAQPGGTLASKRAAFLPLVGALGGMVVPGGMAWCLGAFWPGSPGTAGWAVPTATDAAFTVPVLALCTYRAPTGARFSLPLGLRSFIMALAVFDDLGAIIEIALFYGHHPSLPWLGASLVLITLMVVLGRWGSALPPKGSTAIAALCWALSGLLWLLLEKSGVEPTMAGVALGFCLPWGNAIRAERWLRPVCLLLVVPLFALASTAIDMGQLRLPWLCSAPFLGAALGLWLGKPLGITGAVSLARLFMGRGGDWPRALQGWWLWGGAMVCGIGFTMSLLVATLAYHGTNLEAARCGILVGSLLSGGIGFRVLKHGLRVSAHTPLHKDTL